MSVERVGGVEPETVTLWPVASFDGRWHWQSAPFTPGGQVRTEFIPEAHLRSVEEELRQAREERDAYRASWEREATDAARYRLHHEACVRQRDEARKAATGWVEDVSSMAARVDDMAGDLRACRAALDWYAKEDRYDVGRASSRPVVLADRGLLARRALAALSPVQGEHHAQPEGESQMDDNNLNHLIGERDAMKWVDGFLTVVPDADRDLMHTWFACAIESGRMTIQGEHEQDGEDGVSPSLDEVYAERNKVVLAFAALVKEQGWDVGLTVDPSSPDWPVLMIETDAGQVSWHFQAGELPPGLPLFAGKWDGHSTPEKYARLAELVRSAFGLSREIAQDGDTA